MIKNNNLITQIENKKPVELVQEINNEFPSYEEFMKSYESDGSLNYNDLNGGEVGGVKGYGPGNSQSTEETAKYVGKKVVSKTTGSLLGPAALPIGASLKVASHAANALSSLAGGPGLDIDFILADEETRNNPKKGCGNVSKKVRREI